MKTVTITDIAKASGVSIKTVSRVLNGEANVSDAKRDLVKKIAKRLGYEPNISARMLRSQRSYVIVHFHNNPNADYLDKIYKGLNRVARDAGYFAVIEKVASPYVNTVKDYLRRFRIDGVMLSPPLSDDLALIKLLKEQHVPFVRISPRSDRGLSSCSYIDDIQAAGDMTRHLIDQGHNNIAFISGPSDHAASRLRRQGFEAGVTGAGLDAKACPILRGDFSVRSGFEICEKLLNAAAPVSAIFAANDDMAVGAVVAALKAGLDVPADLSISGFDGSRLGEIIWPQLTTIFQPVQDMATEAARRLLAEIAQPDLEKVSHKFDVKLLLRGTTGIAQ